MIRLVALVLTAAFGFGVARDAPPQVHAHPGTFVVALLVVCACCYFAGGYRRPAAMSEATAVAVARSSSRSKASARGGDARVQVVVLPSETGAASRGRVAYAGLDEAPWLASAPTERETLAQIEALDPELLDHFDPVDVLEAARDGRPLAVPVDDQED